MQDITNEADIAILIDRFYEQVLDDDELAPIFVDVAQINLDRHKGFIRSYWEKLLLQKPGYSRHTMNIHRALAEKTRLAPEHFQRWLSLFRATVDGNFSGDTADRAKLIATNIAANMQRDMVR